MDVKNNAFEKALDLFLKQRTKANENLSPTPHLDEDMLNALFESRLSPREKTFFAAHLIDCSSCRRVTARFAQTVFEDENFEVPASNGLNEKSENGILNRLTEIFFNASDNAVLAHQSDELNQDDKSEI